MIPDLRKLITKGQRPVPTGWREAPLDMKAAGFKAMLVIHLPVKREWSEHRRNQVAQRVANAALAELHTAEDES